MQGFPFALPSRSVSAAAHHARYTVDEYVRLEQLSNTKHEYLNGTVYAMAGGTPEHAALAMAVGASMAAQLRDRPCRVYSSDVRVRVVATGLDTYPDVTVVCGNEERDVEDKLALVNPVVLVEVTSDSSDEYDRGEKREHFQRIPTLREIVIVSHRQRLIEVWHRETEGRWTVLAASSGERARLEAIGCALEVDEVYRDPFVGTPA